MSNLRISSYEALTDLGLEQKAVMNGDKKEFLLSQDDIDKIINAVGQRISSVYQETHRKDSGDEDDLMLGSIIDELNEAFKDNKNTNKPRIR
jgi:hypothetical protein